MPANGLLMIMQYREQGLVNSLLALRQNFRLFDLDGPARI
jgi:hypothetical protein